MNPHTKQRWHLTNAVGRMSASVRQVSGTFISPFALATRPQPEQTGGTQIQGKSKGGWYCENEVGTFPAWGLDTDSHSSKKDT